MKLKILVLSVWTALSQLVCAQTYPTFGPEIKVTITGLTFDAMEPFLSLDGTTLFFNSLNSGGNTNLYYATKLNDSTFTYVGLVGGTYDSAPDHLDAVASLDSLEHFFWVSLRDYPVIFENLHRGNYSAGSVDSITRVYGDFNIYTPGWLIMDAAINWQGDQLYYCNAFFDGCAFGMPCEARLGIAEKLNDSTFNKITNTDAVFSNVNDTNYIVYAPQVTKDGLELYFTRILKTTVNSEICVSVRNSTADTFSLPVVIHANNGYVPEAPTFTTDKQKLYYHQKDTSGIFKIYLRYRTGMTEMKEQPDKTTCFVYPNPAGHAFNVVLADPASPFTITLLTPGGQVVFQTSGSSFVDVSNLPNGLYFLNIEQNNNRWTTQLVKE
jgi:hypothetical protein